MQWRVTARYAASVRGCDMAQEEALSMDEVVDRIARMTQSLLEEGANPREVAFVLTSIAADMGLQVAGDPLKVFPVLLDAIAEVAKTRLRKETESRSLELADQHPGQGVTIH
jgi:hypothetical protein